MKIKDKNTKKIKTRISVFETNSSSCHSISIAKGSKDVLYDTIEPNEKGEVILDLHREFGWNYEEYNDPMSKANYLFIYIMDWSNLFEWEDQYVKKEGKETKLSVQELFDKYVKDSTFWKIFETVILYHTKGKKIKLSFSYDGYYEYGYIDHDSVENEDLHYLFENPKLMKEFLFNPNSILIIDNDNH